MRTLSQLEMKEISRIQAVLQNMGCRYSILLPDGTRLGGDLRSIDKQRKQRKRLCNWEKYKVQEQLNAMRPGDTLRFKLNDPAPYTLQGLQKVISGAAAYTLGAGCLLTAMHADTLEVEALCVDRKVSK